MNAIEILKDEHRMIISVMDILEKICLVMEDGKKVDPADLEQIVEFLKVFADHSHHAKEEDLLFPAMEKAGVPREGGPIGVMLAEHDEGRGYIQEISAGIEKYKINGSGAEEIIENAQNYINLLRQHIDKEDNILYMIAERSLSSDAQKKLSIDFEQVEAQQTGLGTHREAEEFLRRLEKTYSH